MPNPYFQFRKFTIRQDRCAMKVCTDSCLFGAWVADYMQRKSKPAGNVLDVGSGTGLLSLLLAQKIRARIDAVEIDQHSFEQAASNVAESPFFQQIHVFNSDFRSWFTESMYDVIISNPPFYENGLLSEDDGRNLSKHSGTLSLESLIVKSKNLLHEAGFLAVLLPGHRAAYFENIASHHALFVEEKTFIRQTPRHNYFRAILLLRQARMPLKQSSLEIRNATNGYSAEFIRLLKDYYLHL